MRKARRASFGRAALGLSAILLLAADVAAEAEQLWLVVGASDASPAAIARKASALSQGRAPGLVFDSRDCGDGKSVLGWAVEIAETPAAAQAALARVRGAIGSAYLKRCSVRPGSLLSVRYPAVDPSIARVPEETVHWSDADRTSSAVSLTAARVAIIVRYYVEAPDDEQEGRRQRIVLAAPAAAPVAVMDPCFGAGGIAVRGDRIAFHCATERAAEQDLHTTFVVDLEGNRVAEYERCRAPVWLSEERLTCASESISSDGRVRVRAKKLRLP